MCADNVDFFWCKKKIISLSLSVCVCVQIECVKMIVASSAHLATSRTSFLNAMGKAVSLTTDQTSSHENVATRIHDLKVRSYRRVQDRV